MSRSARQRFRIGVIAKFPFYSDAAKRKRKQIMVGSRLIAVGTLGMVMPVQAAEDYSFGPRWGQAATYIPSPPSILIQGGKTDPSRSFTYTSSPNTADTILLPLSAPFATSAAPFQLLNVTTAPAYSWHTLSPLSHQVASWTLLSFGGDGAPFEPVQTLANSAWIWSLDASRGVSSSSKQPTGWGSEPMRHIYHSAATQPGGGRTIFTGGLKDDGFGEAFKDVFSFDPETTSFSTLPSLPEATYHHTSILLPNGTLVLLGGVYLSSASGTTTGVTLAEAQVLDTTSATSAWTTVPLGGTAPTSRRGLSTALSGNSKRIFVFGGADAALSEVFADGWSLDLDTSQWKRITDGTGGAGARFDHSALAVGGEQLMILGGYGTGGPASPGPFIVDMVTGQWSSFFVPPVVSPANVPSTSAAMTLVPSSASEAGVDSPKVTRISSSEAASSLVGIDSSSAREPSPSAQASTDAAQGNSVSLPLGGQLGLIFGVLGIAGALVGFLLWRYRRRKRREALNQSVYGAASAPSRPYGNREKGGVGLMEEGRNDMDVSPDTPGEKQSAGLGFGNLAIGAGLTSIPKRFARQEPSDAYAVLGDLPPDAGGPVRRSTRRVGTGIRLVRPRTSTSSESRYAPLRLGKPSRHRSAMPDKDSRMNMLRDEDSRNFRAVREQEEEDWTIESENERGNWRSAVTLLGSRRQQDLMEVTEMDPFDDDEVSLRPPLQGGPVPTPQDSRVDLSHNPFEEPRGHNPYQLPEVSSEPLDLDCLLPPAKHQRHSAYSEFSAPSAMSDSEEGIVHFAQIASPATTASIMSPADGAYQPIKRTETFFRRMAAGGISSLLPSTSRRRSTTKRELDIRDPAPLPTLWRVISRDDQEEEGVHDQQNLRSGGNGSREHKGHPPSSWQANDLAPPNCGHNKGPSLTSLSSARSMRDMVIVQREGTDSTGEGESAVVEFTSPSNPPMMGATETPGSVVFSGDEFAMSPEVSDEGSRDTFGNAREDGRSDSPPGVSQEIPSLGPAITTSSSSSGQRPSTGSSSTTPAAKKTIPTSGASPTPLSPFSHRRPVRDVVNSINKRGRASPMSLFSPASSYPPQSIVPSPNSTPTSIPARNQGRNILHASSPGRAVFVGGRGKGRTYEAIKRREILLVANPDGGSSN